MDEGASLFFLWVGDVGGPALKCGVDACMQLGSLSYLAEELYP